VIRESHKHADEKRPSAVLSSSLVNGVLFEYAFFLGISRAFHLGIFDQSLKMSSSAAG